MTVQKEVVLKSFERYVNEFVPCCSTDDYDLDMLKATLQLLKEQEPRVLTRKEVQNDCPDYVYLETSTGRLECCIKDEGESDKRVGDFVYELDEFFIKAWKDYGKTWRCWSNRPTEEQRKAVKWDEQRVYHV